MTSHALSEASIRETIRTKWGWFLFLGIIFLLGGFVAFISPFFATVVVTLVVAACLVLTGIIQLIQAWTVKSWGGFLWQLLIGLVLVIGGSAIYLNPVASAFAITLFAAAMFLAKGIFEIILGLQIRPYGAWGWIVAAGVLAILVGLMILMDYPFSGAYALGILAGVSLMFTGWSYIAVALAARRLD